MSPVPGEYLKTINIEEIRSELPKQELISKFDQIANEYDSEELINNPEGSERLITDLTEYLYDTEEKRLNNERGDDPVRAVQAIYDGWGDLYGLGFGIEVAFKDGEKESHTGVEEYWKVANTLEKIEDGVYTSFIPKYYSHREKKNVNVKNNGHQGSEREIILCSARVTTSELFRNMGIPEGNVAEIMKGVYQNVRERAERETTSQGY